MANPYANFYDKNFGSIIGKPLSFNDTADPNQRVYQDTMLKNNTVIYVTPGKYDYNKSDVMKADEIYNKHIAAIDKILNDPNTYAREVAINKQNAEVQKDILDAGVDFRYLVYKPDIPQFLKAFQLMINRTGTSLFNKSMGSTDSKFFTDILSSLSTNTNAAMRGFPLWVEKSTSVSESVDTSLSSSIFEGFQGKISKASRELQMLTGNMVGGTLTPSERTETTTEGGVGQREASAVNNMLALATTSLSGNKISLPQIWDDSKFSRSYNIAFKFTSPYGDDRSVYVNVILPFLFILACSLPRQTENTAAGFTFPFICQIDCPGYFSTPMGIIQNLSFTKGGDESLWSKTGLPLVIQGTFSVVDLYNNLSLPTDNALFATNLGTAAFLNNLVGGSLYSSVDTSFSADMANWTKGKLIKLISPLNELEQAKLAIMRYTGVGL